MIQKQITLLAIICLSFSTIHAQKLISKTNKTWKTHWGVTGGVGLSNFLENALSEHRGFTPEGVNAFSIMYAPRPEVNLGLFTEIEFSAKFSFRASLTYAMRAIPKPIYLTAASDPVGNAYQSIYLNGVGTDAIFYFHPIPKLKLGLGFDMAHYFMTKQFMEGDYGTYSHKYMGYHGLKTVVAYNVNARMDISLYVSAGASMMSQLQFDNISAGTAIAYRIRGKEFKVQKEIYRIDYTK